MRTPELEVTSIDYSCLNKRFAWRPLLQRLREKFWGVDDAPCILVGLNPDLCEGERGHPQGWHIAWLTGSPVGQYASLDSYSLEMNLEHDLRDINATLKVGGPDDLSPNGWIEWAMKRGLSPPWLPAINVLRSIAAEKSLRRRQKSERHSHAAKQRRNIEKFDLIRNLIWQELDTGVSLKARGRKSEFDRRMADKHGIDQWLAQRYRLRWQKQQDAE